MSEQIQKKTLLALDLSTSCVGFAFFNIEGRGLVDAGQIKPKVPKVSKLKYPRQQWMKMHSIGAQILELCRKLKPDHIVIEEIAGSKQRLGQKVLDGLHWIVLNYLDEYIDFSNISYYDVSGTNGWRTHLGIRLSDADKAANKEARKLNKKLDRKSQLPIIGWKDLSVRFANSEYNLNLVLKQNDIADAVSFGNAFLKFRCTEL